MPIHIQTVKSDHTVIPSTLTQADGLSPEALGVLVHFLTMPEDWNPSMDDLDIFEIGSFKAKRIFRELQQIHCLYGESRRDEKGHHQTKLWHVSNVPLTDDEFKVMIQAADPDHLPGNQHEEVAENTNEISEGDATIQIEDSVKKPLESLYEDEHRDVQEKVVAESKNEPAVDRIMYDIGDPVETPLESPPDDMRRDVHEKVAVEREKESSEAENPAPKKNPKKQSKGKTKTQKRNEARRKRIKARN